MITVKNATEGFNLIVRLYPTWELELDEASSERAGYPTWRDKNEFYNYVCDLGDHLEINIKEGNQTERIYFEAEPTDVIDTGLYFNDEQLDYIVRKVKKSLSEAILTDDGNGSVISERATMLYDMLTKIGTVKSYML